MNFKKFRKFRRNVKAISPVISVLLMIAVAVVASLVVYAWVMGFVGNKTNQVGKAIQIQSVARIGTTLSVYTQNVGDSPVTFSSPCIYINGTAATGVSGTPALGQSIASGSTVTFTTTNTINSGDTVTVKVASTDGTFSQVTHTIP